MLAQRQPKIRVRCCLEKTHCGDTVRETRRRDVLDFFMCFLSIMHDANVVCSVKTVGPVEVSI